MKDLLDIIKMAKSLEITRYNQYKEGSDKVTSPEGKKVLLFLASAEKRHIRLLKEQALKIKTRGEIEIKKALKTKTEFPKGKEDRNFEETAKGISGDINIFEKAIRLEEKDVKFYNKYCSKTGRESRRLFCFLEGEEKFHKRLLKSKLKEMQKASVALSTSRSPKVLYSKIMKRKKIR